MKFLIIPAIVLLSVVSSASQLCVDKNVVYTQNGTHYDAKIVELYADGTAGISFPNGEYAVSQVSTSTLSDHLRVFGGFGVGDSVVYSQNGVHYDAKIDALYDDGMAAISFPNGEYSESQISISTLSRSLRQEGSFSVGESVVYTQNGTHYDTKIDALYADGMAAISFPNGEYSESQISISTLSPHIYCTGGCRD